MSFHGIRTDLQSTPICTQYYKTQRYKYVDLTLIPQLNNQGYIITFTGDSLKSKKYSIMNK